MKHLSDKTLQAFVDGTLGKERAAVQQHLQTCATCRQQLAAYQAIAKRLHAAPPPSLPADFATRVMTRLPRQPESLTDWQAWLVFASAIAISLAAAVYFVQWGRLLEFTWVGFGEIMTTLATRITSGIATAKDIHLPQDLPVHGLFLALFALVTIALVDWAVSQFRQRQA